MKKRPRPSAAQPIYKHPRKLASTNNSSQLQPINDIDSRILIDKLLDEPNLKKISYQKLAQLLEITPAYQSQCIKQRNYAKAKQIQDLTLILKEELSCQNKLLTNFNEKSEKAKDFADTTLENEFVKFPGLESQISKFDNETEQKKSQIENRHKQIFESFDDMWTNKLSKNYGGESHKLRTLRKSEKEFTSEGDHARAAYVKNEINKLEEIERQNAQQNYEKDYKNAKEKLQFKFQNEMRQFMRERTLQRNMIIGRVNKTVLITKPKPTTSARPISQLSGYLFDQKTQSQRNRNRTNYSTTIFNQPNQLHHDESFTSQTESNQNDSETSQKECNCDNNNHEIEPNLAENHEFEGMFIDDDVSTCVGEINNNQNGSNNSDVQIKSRSISSFDDKLHNTPNDTSKSETDINHSNSKIEEEYYEYYDDSVESTIHNETENENDDEKDRNIDENQRFENHSENELDNFELNVSSDDSFITKNKNNHIDENTSETTKEDGEISIPFDIDESKEKFTEIKERAIILGFNYQSDEIESGEVEDGELVPFESLSQEEMSENTLITKNEEGQIPNKNSSTELEYSTISSSEKSTKDDSPKDDSTKEDSPKEDSTKEDSTKEDSPKEYTNKEDSNKEDSSNGLSA